MCVELERNFEAVKKKFLGVLAYFGEDSNMSSTDFFTTLHKFVLVSCTLYCFITSRILFLMLCLLYILGICLGSRYS